MKNIDNKSENYINELQDKIVELSLKLKGNSNELKSVQKSHDFMISKLIHNLKNPIGIAYSFSDMMLDSLENYTPEKLEKHLHIINDSSAFSIKLLNDFAVFKELKSSNLTVNIEKSNYIEILNSIIEKKFEKSILEKGITLIKDFPKEAIYLKVDYKKIRLAITNIIDNAIRFSNENSKITIKVIGNSNTIETIISDEGIGIAEINLKSVFKEFFVVNTYSNDKQKCIGLGLSISNKIIQKHQGKVLVKSTLGKGTIFKIILPAI